MKIEYHNLYNHFIFTTIKRLPLIEEMNRIRIEKYMTGIIDNSGSKLYAIYANPEHVHFLVSRSPQWAEEVLATIVADSTTKFVNENGLCKRQFQWQQSASIFSISKRSIDKVCHYIVNQPEHHKKVSFEEEYGSLVRYYERTMKLPIVGPYLAPDHLGP